MGAFSGLRVYKIASLFLIFIATIQIQARINPSTTTNVPGAIRQISRVVDVTNKIAAEEDRIADIKLINGGVEPFKSPYRIIVIDDQRQTGNGNWITYYAGIGLDLEVCLIIVIPILFSQLLRRVRSFLYPDLKFRENIPEHPLIPLTYLQQTKDELRVTREKRNGLDWLGTKFLIRASDSFVDLKDLMNKNAGADVHLGNRPWKLLRVLAAFNGLYARNTATEAPDYEALHPSTASKIAQHLEASDAFLNQLSLAEREKFLAKAKAAAEAKAALKAKKAEAKAASAAALKAKKAEARAESAAGLNLKAKAESAEVLDAKAAEKLMSTPVVTKSTGIGQPLVEAKKLKQKRGAAKRKKPSLVKDKKLSLAKDRKLSIPTDSEEPPKGGTFIHFNLEGKAYKYKVREKETKIPPAPLLESDLPPNTDASEPVEPIDEPPSAAKPGAKPFAKPGTKPHRTSDDHRRMLKENNIHRRKQREEAAKNAERLRQEMRLHEGEVRAHRLRMMTHHQLMLLEILRKKEAALAQARQAKLDQEQRERAYKLHHHHQMQRPKSTMTMAPAPKHRPQEVSRFQVGRPGRRISVSKLEKNYMKPQKRSGEGVRHHEVGGHHQPGMSRKDVPTQNKYVKKTRRGQVRRVSLEHGETHGERRGSSAQKEARRERRGSGPQKEARGERPESWAQNPPPPALNVHQQPPVVVISDQEGELSKVHKYRRPD